MTRHEHEEMRGRLHDFVDECLDERERLEVAEHLAACAECRAEVDGIRDLLARAKDLPASIDPARDLWPGIEERIALPSPAQVGARTPSDDPCPGSSVAASARSATESFSGRGASVLGGRLRGHLRWTVSAAFAAAAIVVWVVVSPRGSDPSKPAPQVADLGSNGQAEEASRGGGNSPGAPAIFLPALVRSLELECMGAGKQLQASWIGSSALGQETAADVGEEIRVLDRAIAETRQALEEDPRNARLVAMLTSRYQSKLALLHRVTRLAQEA